MKNHIKVLGMALATVITFSIGTFAGGFGGTSLNTGAELTSLQNTSNSFGRGLTLVETREYPNLESHDIPLSFGFRGFETDEYPLNHGREGIDENLVSFNIPLSFGFQGFETS